MTVLRGTRRTQTSAGLNVYSVKTERAWWLYSMSAQSEEHVGATFGVQHNIVYVLLCLFCPLTSLLLHYVRQAELFHFIPALLALMQNTRKFWDGCNTNLWPGDGANSLSEVTLAGLLQQHSSSLQHYLSNFNCFLFVCFIAVLCKSLQPTLISSCFAWSETDFVFLQVF